MKKALVLVVMAMGCISNDGAERSIAVGEPNGAGVTTLAMRTFDEAQRHVFELRGLGADGDQRALVRVSAGTTDSQVLIAVENDEQELTAAASGRLRLPALGDPHAQEFVELATVASVLEHEAQVVISKRSATRETAYYVMDCPPQYLLNNQSVSQCCYTYDGTTAYTVFVNSAASVVYRDRNPYGTACKKIDGVSSCSGMYNASTNPNGCYYGPNGFGVAYLGYNNGANYPYVYTYGGGNYCTHDYVDQYPSPIFPTMSGSFPSGQGCPGGGSAAGGWDY